MRSKIPAFLSLAVAIAGLAAGLVLVRSRQEIRSRAWNKELCNSDCQKIFSETYGSAEAGQAHWEAERALYDSQPAEVQQHFDANPDSYQEAVSSAGLYTDASPTAPTAEQTAAITAAVQQQIQQTVAPAPAAAPPTTPAATADLKPSTEVLAKTKNSPCNATLRLCPMYDPKTGDHLGYVPADPEQGPVYGTFAQAQLARQNLVIGTGPYNKTEYGTAYDLSGNISGEIGKLSAADITKIKTAAEKWQVQTDADGVMIVDGRYDIDQFAAQVEAFWTEQNQIQTQIAQDTNTRLGEHAAACAAAAQADYCNQQQLQDYIFTNENLPARLLSTSARDQLTPNIAAAADSAARLAAAAAAARNVNLTNEQLRQQAAQEIAEQYQVNAGGLTQYVDQLASQLQTQRQSAPTTEDIQKVSISFIDLANNLQSQAISDPLMYSQIIANSRTNLTSDSQRDLFDEFFSSFVTGSNLILNVDPDLLSDSTKFSLQARQLADLAATNPFVNNLLQSYLTDPTLEPFFPLSGKLAAPPPIANQILSALANQQATRAEAAHQANRFLVVFNTLGKNGCTPPDCANVINKYIADNDLSPNVAEAFRSAVYLPIAQTYAALEQQRSTAEQISAAAQPLKLGPITIGPGILTSVRKLTNLTLAEAPPLAPSPIEISNFAVDVCQGADQACLGKLTWPQWQAYYQVARENPTLKNLPGFDYLAAPPLLNPILIGRIDPLALKNQLDLVTADPVNRAAIGFNNLFAGTTARGTLLQKEAQETGNSLQYLRGTMIAAAPPAAAAVAVTGVALMPVFVPAIASGLSLSLPAAALKATGTAFGVYATAQGIGSTYAVCEQGIFAGTSEQRWACAHSGLNTLYMAFGTAGGLAADAARITAVAKVGQITDVASAQTAFQAGIQANPTPPIWQKIGLVNSGIGLFNFGTQAWEECVAKPDGDALNCGVYLGMTVGSAGRLASSGLTNLAGGLKSEGALVASQKVSVVSGQIADYADKLDGIGSCRQDRYVGFNLGDCISGLIDGFADGNFFSEKLDFTAPPSYQSHLTSFTNFVNTYQDNQLEQLKLLTLEAIHEQRQVNELLATRLPAAGRTAIQDFLAQAQLEYQASQNESNRYTLLAAGYFYFQEQPLLSDSQFAAVARSYTYSTDTNQLANWLQDTYLPAAAQALANQAAAHRGQITPDQVADISQNLDSAIAALTQRRDALVAASQADPVFAQSAEAEIARLNTVTTTYDELANSFSEPTTTAEPAPSLADQLFTLVPARVTEAVENLPCALGDYSLVSPVRAAGSKAPCGSFAIKSAKQHIDGLGEITRDETGQLFFGGKPITKEGILVTAETGEPVKISAKRGNKTIAVDNQPDTGIANLFQPKQAQTPNFDENARTVILEKAIKLRDDLDRIGEDRSGQIGPYITRLRNPDLDPLVTGAELGEHIKAFAPKTSQAILELVTQKGGVTQAPTNQTAVTQLPWQVPDSGPITDIKPISKYLKDLPHVDLELFAGLGNTRKVGQRQVPLNQILHAPGVSNWSRVARAGSGQPGFSITGRYSDQKLLQMIRQIRDGQFDLANPKGEDPIKLIHLGSGVYVATEGTTRLIAARAAGNIITVPAQVSEINKAYASRPWDLTTDPRQAQQQYELARDAVEKGAKPQTTIWNQPGADVTPKGLVPTGQKLVLDLLVPLPNPKYDAPKLKALEKLAPSLNPPLYHEPVWTNLGQEVDIFIQSLDPQTLTQLTSALKRGARLAISQIRLGNVFEFIPTPTYIVGYPTSTRDWWGIRDALIAFRGGRTIEGIAKSITAAVPFIPTAPIHDFINQKWLPLRAAILSPSLNPAYLLQLIQNSADSINISQSPDIPLVAIPDTLAGLNAEYLNQLQPGDTIDFLDARENVINSFVKNTNGTWSPTPVQNLPPTTSQLSPEAQNYFTGQDPEYLIRQFQAMLQTRGVADVEVVIQGLRNDLATRGNTVEVWSEHISPYTSLTNFIALTQGGVPVPPAPESSGDRKSQTLLQKLGLEDAAGNLKLPWQQPLPPQISQEVSAFISESGYFSIHPPDNAPADVVNTYSIPNQDLTKFPPKSIIIGPHGTAIEKQVNGSWKTVTDQIKIDEAKIVRLYNLAFSVQPNENLLIIEANRDIDVIGKELESEKYFWEARELLEKFRNQSWPPQLASQAETKIREYANKGLSNISSLPDGNQASMLLWALETDDTVINRLAQSKLDSLLEGWGLDPQETIDAWKNSYPKSVGGNGHIALNLGSATRLERQRPGILKTLQDDFGIRSFSRYSEKLLISQFDQKDSLGPYGIVVTALSDHNEAFGHHGDTFDPLANDLQNRYFLRFTEAGSKISLARTLIRMRNRYGKLSFIIIQGHGTENSIILSAFEKLTAGDLAKSGALDLDQFFEPNPTIALFSCSTGIECGIGQQMSQRLKAVVIAPPIDTGIESISARFTDNGKPIFDVKYHKSPASTFFSGETFPSESTDLTNQPSDLKYNPVDSPQNDLPTEYKTPQPAKSSLLNQLQNAYNDKLAGPCGLPKIGLSPATKKSALANSGDQVLGTAAAPCPLNPRNWRWPGATPKSKNWFSALLRLLPSIPLLQLSQPYPSPSPRPDLPPGFSFTPTTNSPRPPVPLDPDPNNPWPRVDVRSQDNTTTVDSQPFFPIGLYFLPGPDTAETWSRLNASGFNTVWLAWANPNLLQTAGQNGLMVVADLETTFPQGADPSLIASLESYSNLLAWYGKDEPAPFTEGELAGQPIVSPQFYDWIVSQDPNHPVWSNFSDSAVVISLNQPGFYGNPDLTKRDFYTDWLEKTNSRIVSFDSNYLNYRRGLGSLEFGPLTGQYVDEFGNAGTGSQTRSVWTVLPAHGETPGIGLSYLIIKSQAVDSIVHGARGVFWWDWPPGCTPEACAGYRPENSTGYSVHWDEITRVTGELNAVMPGLVGNRVHQTSGPVSTLITTGADGLIYVFAANNSVTLHDLTETGGGVGQPVFSQRLGHFPPNTVFEVIGENRLVYSDQNGRITDTFEPSGSHIYKQSNQPAFVSP